MCVWISDQSDIWFSTEVSDEKYSHVVASGIKLFKQGAGTVPADNLLSAPQ